MKVTVTRQTATKYLIQVIKDEKIEFCQVLNPFTATGQDRIQQITRLELPSILEHITKLDENNPTCNLNVIPKGAVNPDIPFVIYVRPLHATLDDVTVINEGDIEATLKKALEHNSKFSLNSEPIIQWDGNTRLTTLDIDYHTFPYNERPSDLELLKIISQVQPQPFCYHISHGRGMKLFYIAQSDFTAEELAACAGLSWLQLDGKATAELKNVTRHPLYPRGEYKCGEINWSSGNSDLSEVGKWLGKSIDESARDEWLANRGLKVGSRYSHKICPIDNSHNSHGEPVYISETGVYCHSCEGMGKHFGNHKKPGWIPWNGILGGIDSRIGMMVKKMCHWTHGKYLLKNVYPGMKEELLKLAYSAAIKLVHSPDDPRIDNVFVNKTLIRFPGRWMLDGSTTLQRDSAKDLLSLLPCVQYVNKQGKVIVNAGDLAELKHGDNDLSKYGIYDVKPIRGCKIWGQFLPYSDENIPFLTYNNRIPLDKQPKYIFPKDRMDVEKAWEKLYEVYPGINRQYVELLIAAKGVCEGGIDDPMIAVAGPGGSSKTHTVSIAANICGDSAGDVVWMSNTERLRQSIMAKLDEGDFIRIDEIFKCGERERKSPREALDPILNFGSDSVSHKMYVGPVRLGRKFPLVITDIVTPTDIQRDIQLSRRLTYVRLTNRVPDWRITTANNGISDSVSFRAKSKEFAEAADAILSDVIDRYFSVPTNWSDIISHLGFEKLEHSSDFDNPKEVLVRFFKEVCAASREGGQSENHPYKSSLGWKKISRDFNSNDILSDTWLELCDGPMEKWFQSRRCSEVDWRQVLKVDSDVFLDIRKFKNNNLYVRFRVGRFDSPDKLNEQIAP